ncbi:MAG: hypothetical protein LBH96_00020 [Candidatus Peribacteria bacterium]|jgi:hypothetical protein|nr:hypothetical protein [Candidatus Peribacteria bacterium]
MNLREVEQIAQSMGGIFSLQQLRIFESDFLRTNLVRWERQGYIKRITK